MRDYVVKLIANLWRDHVLHKNCLIVRDICVILLQALETVYFLFLEGFYGVQLGNELVGERDVEGGGAPQRDKLVKEIARGSKILQTGHVQETHDPSQH